MLIKYILNLILFKYLHILFKSALFQLHLVEEIHLDV